MKVLEGNSYRHIKTGNVYSVLTVALNEADLTPVVVYQRWHDDGDAEEAGRHVWVLPVSEFCDGRFEPVG